MSRLDKQLSSSPSHSVNWCVTWHQPVIHMFRQLSSMKNQDFYLWIEVSWVHLRKLFTLCWQLPIVWGIFEMYEVVVPYFFVTASWQISSHFRLVRNQMFKKKFDYRLHHVTLVAYLRVPTYLTTGNIFIQFCTLNLNKICCHKPLYWRVDDNNWHADRKSHRLHSLPW